MTCDLRFVPAGPLVTAEVDSLYHLFPRANRRQETKNQPRLKRLIFAFDHLLSVIFLEILYWALQGIYGG